MRSCSLLILFLVSCATAPPPLPPQTAGHALPTRAQERAVQAELENIEKAITALESQGQFVTDPITLSELLKDPAQREELKADIQALSAFTRDVLVLTDAAILAVRALPGSYQITAREELIRLLRRVRTQVGAIDRSAETLGLPRTFPQVPRSFIPI